MVVGADGDDNILDEVVAVVEAFFLQHFPAWAGQFDGVLVV